MISLIKDSTGSPVAVSSEKIEFMMSFKLNEQVDLHSTAKSCPEGIVLCSPVLIAGSGHIEGILSQAKEYWTRGEALARNKSIDLLMRITCKKQILEAVDSSGLSNAESVAIFGYADGKGQIEKSIEAIRLLANGLERCDELLGMSEKKGAYLRKFHTLPKWMNDDQVVVALKEKSALLVFVK